MDLSRETFQQRRRALARRLGKGHSLLVATHGPTVFSHDVHHPFRPQSDFWYLTGFGEPGAVALIEGGSGRTTLWLRERDPRREIWDGRRLGVDDAPAALGVQAARPITELSKDLASRRGELGTVHAILDHDVRLRSRVKRALGTLEPGQKVVSEMRVRKSPEELRMLRKACSIGMDAMRSAAAMCRPGAHEHDVEAVLLATYRHAGSEGWGYPPIVGAGANASILHYIENRDRIRKGDLVLIDAGCSWGHYTCDITRTYPANGRFDATQAALYDIVEEARRKAIAKVRPGESIRAPHEEACRVLTEGLVALGYLKGPVEDRLEDHAYRAFFMHGTSHFLGLDVHDAGAYKDEDGTWRRLEEGMVITVEPGLYFNKDFAACPPGTEGIGIRLEDDVAVTSTGRSVLTSKLPTRRDAVEAMLEAAT